MTSQGVDELYQYLGAAWPLVIRPGVDPEWKRAKVRELYQTYKDYEDAEVLAAFQKWTAEHEKFPAQKNIINEIMWAHAERAKLVTGEGVYQMELIDDAGTEYLVSHNGKVNFTASEFVNVPRNKEHLTPDEWERRLRARRKYIKSKLLKERTQA